MPKKDHIRDFLNTLKEPFKSWGLQLHSKYRTYLLTNQSSSKYHCNYPGGAYDHTFNVMVCSKEVYRSLLTIFDIYHKPPGFSYSKLIFTAYVHDLTKEYQNNRKPYRHHTKWYEQFFRDNHISPPEDVMNALFHHHGSYGNRRSTPNSLSFVIHFVDMWSSQILEKSNNKKDEVL